MLFIVLVISAITARAQSSYTTIQYNNKMQPALVLELPYNTDDVEGTIIEKLKQNGYDPESQGHLFWRKNKPDGFYTFNKVNIPSLSSQKLDLLFKVIQKNAEEKSHSTLYFLVSNGNDNFVSPESDSSLWNSSMLFINSFLERAIVYSLEQNILKQEISLKTSQKKLNSLQKDKKDLDQKTKTQKDNIDNNSTSQKKQEQDIENKTKELDSLKAKRKD